MYNRTVIAKQGETGFCFHTPLYDEDENVLVLNDIDIPNCTFQLVVAPQAGGTAIIDQPMDPHPNQTDFPNHIAYFAAEDEMESAAGNYNWEITFTDPNGVITKYPKDEKHEYGLFIMMPALSTS